MYQIAYNAPTNVTQGAVEVINNYSNTQVFGSNIDTSFEDEIYVDQETKMVPGLGRTINKIYASKAAVKWWSYPNSEFRMETPLLAGADFPNSMASCIGNLTVSIGVDAQGEFKSEFTPRMVVTYRDRELPPVEVAHVFNEYRSSLTFKGNYRFLLGDPVAPGSVTPFRVKVSNAVLGGAVQVKYASVVSATLNAVRLGVTYKPVLQ